MGAGYYIFGYLALFGIGWVIFQFYWLRIAFVVVVLAIWGALTVIGPIVIFAKYASEGQYFGMILLPPVSVLPAWFFYLGLKAAQDWYERQNRWGKFWKPWNGR
ncbi:MAG: hypothetical protein GY761_17370 [Hyphomicrobiales bacterium]|nr:hypothetical protein [Hyphomicrobiales bacterium]